MSESTIYPQNIEIDTIIGGVTRLLCHWNIETVLREESTVYKYEEAVIKWPLPDSFVSGEQTLAISTREDVEAYITANATEIMSFAKATKLTM
jgi:hypothetical protein